MHRREVLADVAARMLAHHTAGTTDHAAAVMERPVSAYVDPGRWERERVALFGRAPLVAALSPQLPSAGSQLPLDIAGVPLVLVRDEAGVARAYLNVCRHRGAPVVEQPDCGRRMSCRYHGWTYDLEGSLVGLPGGGCDGLDRSAHGLVAVPCEERAGVVWVIPSPDAHGGSAGSFDDSAMAELHGELAHLGLGDLQHVETRELPAACNWHLAMDTNCESYHFAYLHRNSFSPFVMGNLNVVDHFGPAQRLGFAAATLPSLSGTEPAAWDLPMLEGLIQFVYLVFPNVSLLVLSDHVELFQIFPGDTVETSVLLHSYFVRSSVTTDEQRRIASSAFDMFHDVVRLEDLPIAEAIQRGFAAGAQDHLTFARNEPALQHLHRHYDEVLGPVGSDGAAAV